jgi:hypothetical protein
VKKIYDLRITCGIEMNWKAQGVTKIQLEKI